MKKSAVIPGIWTMICFGYYDTRVKRAKCRSCLHEKAFELGTRQTPTRSGFACKYAGLEVFAGLLKLQGNEAIRGIRWGQNTF